MWWPSTGLAMLAAELVLVPWVHRLKPEEDDGNTSLDLWKVALWTAFLYAILGPFCMFVTSFSQPRE